MTADGDTDRKRENDPKDFKDDTEGGAGVGGVVSANGTDNVVGDDRDNYDGELGDKGGDAEFKDAGEEGGVKREGGR